MKLNSLKQKRRPQYEAVVVRFSNPNFTEGLHFILKLPAGCAAKLANSQIYRDWLKEVFEEVFCE